MIEVKELRVGNIVALEYPDGLEYCEVKTIGISSVGLLNGVGDFNNFSIESIILIPLTKEWLIKLGFKYDEKTNEYKAPGVYGVWFFSVGGDFVYRSLLALTDDYEGYYSVHQLQNLYFALTGEELTL